MKKLIKNQIALIVLSFFICSLHGQIQKNADTTLKNNINDLHNSIQIDSLLFSKIIIDYLSVSKFVDIYFGDTIPSRFVPKYFPNNIHEVKVINKSEDTVLVTITPVFFKAEVNQDIQIILNQSQNFFVIYFKNNITSDLKRVDKLSKDFFLNNKFNDEIIYEKGYGIVKTSKIFEYLVVKNNFGYTIYSKLYHSVLGLKKEYWPIEDYNTWNQQTLGVNFKNEFKISKKYGHRIGLLKSHRLNREQTKKINNYFSNKYRKVL